jgi:3',5'-cyclic AMP phosphodiesterase CpdA
MAVSEAGAGRVFVLAHLSDPHLGPLPRPAAADLASKRLLGYLNWRRGRHRVHRGEVLDAMVRDLRDQQPDHVAVTGDLVNIALPSEFERARRWLDALGPPADVSVVPGNHDAYVAGTEPGRDRRWAPYMAGDDDLSSASLFPYLRRRGPVALVGLSTAVATPLLMATGMLGDRQIARAAVLLADLRSENLFRVVMIHHPPVAGASHHKRLVDAAVFRDAIAACGAELAIHGHHHVHSLSWLAGSDGRVPVVGVPSASAAAGMKHDAAAYNLYRISGAPGGWNCEMVTRGLGPSGEVIELRRLALSSRSGDH